MVYLLPGHTEENPAYWDTELKPEEQIDSAQDYYNSIMIEDNCTPINTEDFGRATRSTRPTKSEFTKDGEPYKVVHTIHYKNTFNKAVKRHEYNLVANGV